MRFDGGLDSSVITKVEAYPPWLKTADLTSFFYLKGRVNGLFFYQKRKHGRGPCILLVNVVKQLAMLING